MKLPQKRPVTTVIMMVLAMIGLTVVQVQLLRNAWHLKEQSFDHNAGAAVALTVKQLELGNVQSEALTIIGRATRSDTLNAEILIKQINLDGMDRIVFNGVAGDSFVHQDPTMSVFYTGGRHEMIQQVVDDLMVLSPPMLTERTSAAVIDSLLRKNLETVGIGMPSRFAVVASEGDSLVFSNTTSFDSNLKNSPYRAQLFPLDFMPPSFDLVVWFPQRSGFLINQIWPLALASFVFMMVVIISFWLNLRIITEQRRASASMVDFINNMTHEFKTPISTVQLASEAIAGQEFENCPESLQRYNRMIHEESRRMSRHAERILQFAYLEEGDLVLEGMAFSMHQVIGESCAAFQLAVQSRQGQLKLDLAAENDWVVGDAVHVANVVTNLVDNAIKYSPDAPEVNVSTTTEDGWFVLTVQDRGQGMSSEDQSRVFERYFRCSTGNRHDVKGFGLGLSYVKLLVDAHQGRIQLKSQAGSGTAVKIFLPTQTEPQNG